MSTTATHKPAFLILALAVIISTAVSWWWGTWVDEYLVREGFNPLAWRVIPLVGTGWFVQIMLVRYCVRDHWAEYLKFISFLMVVGVALLIPWILLSEVVDLTHIAFPIVGVSISSAAMLALHYRKMRALQLPQKLTASWFFALQITAAGWLIVTR
jgi:hypothetical protein